MFENWNFAKRMQHTFLFLIYLLDLLFSMTHIIVNLTVLFGGIRRKQVTYLIIHYSWMEAIQKHYLKAAISNILYS